MRTKLYRKQIWFSRSELDEFEKRFKLSGLKSEGAFVRLLVFGYIPREKPDDRFYEAMKLMRSISNSLNQIATKANSLGFVDTPYYQKEAVKWNNFMLEVKSEFLPLKVNK